MGDHGQPRSYLDADEGVDVVSSDGQVLGKLEHVLADEQSDIFDGIVVDTSAGPGGHRFVDAPQVARIFEQGVELTIGVRDVENLHEPSENPAAMSADPSDVAPDHLSDKLRRAWQLISGNY